MNPKLFVTLHLLPLFTLIYLTNCQSSIVDKDNNLVLKPREDVNITLSIDGFDNNTFHNIAELFNDNVFNATDRNETEDASNITSTESDIEDEEEETDSTWDADMFIDPSNIEDGSNDNSTSSDLEELFHQKKTGGANEMIDDGPTTSTTTEKMSYIQKIPRKPKPTSSRKKRETVDVGEEESMYDAIETSTEYETTDNKLDSADINDFMSTENKPFKDIFNFLEQIAKERNSFLDKKKSASNNEVEDDNQSNEKSSNKKELGWVSKVLTEAMYDFSPELSNNSRCSFHSKLYKNNLQNLTLWALKMLDSSAVTPSGLLAANMYQLGNFDECVNIHLPRYGMRGQYCLATATFSPTLSSYSNYFDEDHSRDFLKPDELGTVWDAVKDNIDPAKIPRNKFYWALCIPSSCTAEDLLLTLDQSLKNLADKYQINFDLSVPAQSCHVKSEEDLPTGFWIYSTIVIFLVCLVSCATFYDLVIFRRKGSFQSTTIKRWLIPFSGLSNMEKLGAKNESEEFSVMHGLKAIAMCQIIIGHRNMNVLGNVTLNPEFTEEKSSQLIWSYFNNGTLVVDTFFLIGGFLTFYFIFFELDKRKGKINYFVVFLYRFIRVTPVYAFVIFFYVYVLPYMNDGPLWKEIIGRESTRCENNWWANLLYINNYYHENEQCMVQSWYLSCDFHFFIAGTFLTFVVWKFQPYAKTILFFVLFTFIALPFSFVYNHNYWGHYRTYISQMRDPVSHPEFQTLYIKSHFRAIPYIMGIIFAYVYIKLKEKKYQFSTMSLWTISLLAFFMGHAPYLMAGLAYIPGRPYYRLENAIFNPFQRIVWSLCMGWIIIGHGTTGFGPISKILGHRVFIPFSRLTFCAYLIHVAVQLTSIATMRTPTYLSYTSMILGVFGDLMFTFFCAFLLNIMIESPLDRFQKKVIKSLMGGFNARSVGKESPIKEEIIEQEFQRGLQPGVKQINTVSTDPATSVIETNGSEHCHF